MKKICFIVAIPFTAEAFLYKHMKCLSERYEVHLVANFPSEEKQKMFRDAGVTCHWAPIQRQISLWADLKAVFALRKIFREEKFQSVHSVTPKAGLLTSIAGWIANAPSGLIFQTVGLGIFFAFAPHIAGWLLEKVTDLTLGLLDFLLA